MFLTDTLKPTSEHTIMLLTYSSKWVDKQTYEKISKYSGLWWVDHHGDGYKKALALTK